MEATWDWRLYYGLCKFISCIEIKSGGEHIDSYFVTVITVYLVSEKSGGSGIVYFSAGNNSNRYVFLLCCHRYTIYR